MKDFKKFGWGNCVFGSWEENFGLPKDQKSGASVHFDAWPICSAVQVRVWHVKEDLKIKVFGERFVITKKETKFFKDFYEVNQTDESSYCTFFTISIDAVRSGFIKVLIEGEETYDNNVISWGKGKITDFSGNEANLKSVNGGYEIEEILTIKEVQNFALRDRVIKLKKICLNLGLNSAAYEIDLGRIHGDFEV